jgi:hypothetical protein
MDQRATVNGSFLIKFLIPSSFEIHEKKNSIRPINIVRR